MRYGKHAGLWAALAALGLFVAPVQGQGVRSDYTQTPGTATYDQNSTVQQFNPNAESNWPGNRTDMSTDARGGVYQPPIDRAGDPESVSDIRVRPGDLVTGPDGSNIRNTQGTVSRGSGTTINRSDRQIQMDREREQRGLRGATTRDRANQPSATERREDRRRGAAGTTTNPQPDTGARGSAISPWVTNQGPMTAPGSVTTPGTVPGTTAPGTTIPPGSVTTPGTVPGTTAPDATIPPGSVTTPGTVPGAASPGATVPGSTVPPGSTAPGTTAPGMGGTGSAGTFGGSAGTGGASPGGGGQTSGAGGGGGVGGR